MSNRIKFCVYAIFAALLILPQSSVARTITNSDVSISAAMTSTITSAFVLNDDGTKTSILSNLSDFLSFQNANHSDALSPIPLGTFQQTRELITYQNLTDQRLEVTTKFDLMTEISGMFRTGESVFSHYRIAELLTYNAGSTGPFNLYFSFFNPTSRSSISSSFTFDAFEDRIYQTDLVLRSLYVPLPASSFGLLTGLAAILAFGARRKRRNVIG